jgi:hypothetical protein
MSWISGILGLAVFVLIKSADLVRHSDRPSTAATEANRTEMTRSDSLQHLLRENHSGLRSPLRAVLQDSAAFRELWDRATIGHRLLPAVDFTREMVVVAAMGARSSTRQSIHIQSVRAEGTALQVRVLLVPLGSGCVAGDMETYPVDIVRAPREDRRVVTFVERIAEEC